MQTNPLPRARMHAHCTCVVANTTRHFFATLIALSLAPDAVRRSALRLSNFAALDAHESCYEAHQTAEGRPCQAKHFDLPRAAR